MSTGGGVEEFEAVGVAPAPLGWPVDPGVGGLPCRYLTHAVSLGPDRRTSAAAIEGATRSAMREAGRLGCETVAFPALGTGVGGFPLDEAAEITVRAVRAELAPDHPGAPPPFPPP